MPCQYACIVETFLLQGTFNKPLLEPLTAEVVVAEPITGCPEHSLETKSTKRIDYTGKLVLASRGDCIFWEKVKADR